MDKYAKDQTVGAVYDNAPAGNPFLAAMPDLLGTLKKSAYDKIAIVEDIYPISFL